jgi:hypothetical protein
MIMIMVRMRNSNFFSDDNNDSHDDSNDDYVTYLLTNNAMMTIMIWSYCEYVCILIRIL